LVGVEHREAFQKGNCAGLVSIAVSPAAFLIWHEAVSIDDGGAVLAFAHIGAEAKRLAKREPILGAEAVLDHGTPEDQHVDPRVLAVGRGILRHGERRVRGHSPPRLNPGHAAGFQLCNDLIGDFLIKARPVSTGTSASG
jgi:hypothetical protein